jgi:hypothetical protein
MGRDPSGEAPARTDRLDEQLVIPGLRPPSGLAEPTPPGEEDRRQPAPYDARQLALFADKVALERDIEAAVRSGAFEDAHRLRDLHRETYGASAVTAGLGFLDVLAPIDFAGDSGLAVSAWEAADDRLRDQATLRSRVRDAVFRRLLACRAAEALAAAAPSCLGAFAGFLIAQAKADGSDTSSLARRLVCEALLAGRAPAASEVAGDAALADLLAEDLPPPWLACLGAVRRLWPVPAASETELRAFLGQELSPDDDALGFWQCLRVAETPGRAEPLLHEARRRMKRLRPELHAAYMRLARPLATP